MKRCQRILFRIPTRDGVRIHPARPQCLSVLLILPAILGTAACSRGAAISTENGESDSDLGATRRLQANPNQPVTVSGGVVITYTAPVAADPAGDGIRTPVSPQKIATADEYADRTVAALMKKWSRHVESIVEGVVTAAEPEVVPADNPPYNFDIITHYAVKVLNSWGTDTGATTEFWSMGGVLPESTTPNSDYPRGSGYSSELYPMVGDQIIIGLSRSQLIPGKIVPRIVGGSHAAITVVNGIANSAPSTGADAGSIGKNTEPFTQVLGRKARIALDQSFGNRVVH